MDTRGNLSLSREKKNNEIFIGGINGKDTVKTVEFNLGFLPEGEFTLNLITDGRDDRSFNFAGLSIDSKKKVKITMMPYGGFAGRLKTKG